MGKKKILFVTVPFHAGVVEVAGSWVPLYLVYLAGAARQAGYGTFWTGAITTITCCPAHCRSAGAADS